MDTKEFNNAVFNTESDDEWEARLRIKISLNMIGRGKKVLDVGCYDGFISEKIAKEGNDVIGLEISKEGVKSCNNRGIKCLEQNLEKKFPFKENTFDVVFAGEIIEHVFDTDKLLQEIKRVLKPEGSLVITTPNIAALTRRLRLLLGRNPHIDIGLISPQGEKSAGHIRYFTIKSLEQLLCRNGFKIERWRTDFILFYSLRLVKLGKLFPSLGWGLLVNSKIKKY